MQKDSTQAKLLSKVVGGFFFDSPCRPSLYIVLVNSLQATTTTAKELQTRVYIYGEHLG